MSSSPGILDGDHYHLHIRLAAGSSLELKTQSYQRLFHMKNGASQCMDIFLEPGASFTYLPHPTVPHASSIFFARNNIYLSKGCRLLWREVLTPGRNLHDETFLFSRYQNLTNIYIDDELVIRENLVLQPFERAVHSTGQLEQYTHQASMIFTDEDLDVKTIIPLLHEWLTVQENLCTGISAAPVNGVIIRMLGYKAEQLHDCLTFMHRHFFSGRKNNRAFVS